MDSAIVPSPARVENQRLSNLPPNNLDDGGTDSAGGTGGEGGGDGCGCTEHGPGQPPALFAFVVLLGLSIRRRA